MSYTNRNFTWDFDALKRFYERYIVKWLNSAVSWTEAQKKQARENLGFGDGDIDAEPIAGSNNLVQSGGVEFVLRTVPKQSSDSSDANLNISDENGNVITQFGNGHIKTKNFNSETVIEKLDTIEEGAEKNNIDSFFDGGSADLNICDNSGNVIAQFEGGHIRTKEFDSRNVYKKTLRICALGNSWTGDAFNYLGALLDEMFAGEVDVHIGWAYKSGCTLQEHYDRSQNNGSYTYYYYWQTSEGKWTMESNKNFDSIINREPWDIIITQQMSDDAPDYTTYQPYLNDLIDNIRLKTTRTVKIGWIATRAKPKTTTAKEIEMYENVISAVQQVINDTIVDFVIPNGTATQNARTTSLVNLGTNRLTTDGSHLQEGVPCLIESYCTALKIAEVFGYPYRGILGSDFLPTQEWIDANGCQGQANGDSTGTDNDNNILLAQKCAIMAVKFPSVITDCGTLFESI